MDELKETISKICEKTGKNENEINELIKAKIEKFEGLLTKQGAVFMVAKELGVKEENGEIKINELKDGMKDTDIQGIIKTIYPVREFEKNGKKGKVGSLLLEDDTGLIRVTLWNEQIEKYDLTIGSEIKIQNGFISSYNDKKQISLGFNGEIEILKKEKEKFEKIADIKAGENNVNLTGRIIRKFPCKEFENGERKGKLCNFQFGDETALLRATAWNDTAQEIENFNEGDVIEIKNAYTKDGMFGVELNLGYNANLKKIERDFPSTIEILKEGIIEKKINQLVEKENVIINVKVKKILDGMVYFNACEKCGKKIDGKICEKCGEVNGEKKAVLNAHIEDDTGEINSTFFGNNALKLIEWKQEDLEKESEEKSSEKLIEEFNEKTTGKQIKLLGYEKINSYTNENEFLVKEIID